MVSIIVPTYNNEKYLRQCVHSVLAQTFTDWELIIVDDGSTDSTGRICDEEAAKDPRIRVVHRENGGVSVARNTGLDIARGSRLFFIDGDDLVPPDALRVLVEEADRTGADIVSGRTVKFSGKNPPSQKCRIDISRMMDAQEAVACILYQEDVDNSFYSKLFEARLLKNYRFREGIIYEDLDLMYRLILENGASVAATDAVVYYYRQHSSSYLHTFSLRRCDALDVTARMTAYIAAHHPSLLPAARSRELSANFNILVLLLLNRWRMINRAKGEDSAEAAARMKGKATAIQRRCVAKIRNLRGGVARDRRARLKNRLASLLPL